MTNSKTTKRALLTSALSILMCVAMLIGTTFAWFTDSASTAVNKIQSGNLDVALEMKDANGEWVSAEGKTLNFKTADGRTDNILWEPGCTYELPELRITNKGNLALKYKLMITGILGDAKLNEVIEWTISNGNAKLVGADDDQSFNSQEYYLLKGESNTLTIEGHMDELAGNKYQGLSIEGVSITVVATQYTYENDSKDNQYDAEAEYDLDVWDGYTTTEPEQEDGVYRITSAAEFAYFANIGYGTMHTANIVLDCDIDLNGQTINGVGSGSVWCGSFDGQGHTVSNFVVNSNGEYYAGLFPYTQGATVKNVTVKDATISGGKQVGAVVGGANGGTVENCKAINCTVVGTKKVGAVVGYTASSYVKSCYAENCTVISGNNEAGEVIGFINTVDAGQVDNTSDNTSKNVTVYKNATTVSTANGLATALTNGGNIVLLNNIDVADAWKTPYVANKTIAVYGNGFTIYNLDKPLLNCYGCNVTIDGLTVANSSVAANGDDSTGVLGAGIILEQAQWCNLKMTDCHVRNSSLSANDTRAGALVGYWIGGGEIKNCSVERCTITSADTAAGIAAHRQAQEGYEAKAIIANCTVRDCTITSSKSGTYRTGVVLGTNAGGTTEITGCSITSNTVGQSNATNNACCDGVGRVAYGNVVVDGTNYDAVN